MGDAGDDCLLTVRTHSLHRRRLEHFPLQYGHSGGGSGRSQDGRCVTSHVDKVTGTGTHLSWHRVRKVTRRRWIGATCTQGYTTKYTALKMNLATFKLANTVSLTIKLFIYMVSNRNLLHSGTQNDGNKLIHFLYNLKAQVI